MRQVRSASAPTSPAETITKTIIERLEAGVRPWRQPWTGGSVSRPLRVCGTPYRGINVIWLWMAAQACRPSVRRRRLPRHGRGSVDRDGPGDEPGKQAMTNTVLLVGNLGADPDTRSTRNDTRVTTISLGTSRPKRDSEGKTFKEPQGLSSCSTMPIPENSASPRSLYVAIQC